MSHRAFGILKIPIVYVGMAWANVLISLSLPTFEMIFSFHPITFLVIYSCRPLNVLTFDLPSVMGKPRNGSQSSIILPPNSAWISAFTESLVFLLKKMDLLCLFIACLEAASYLPRIFSRCCPSYFVAWQKIRLLSANNK